MIPAFELAHAAELSARDGVRKSDLTDRGVRHLLASSPIRAGSVSIHPRV